MALSRKSEYALVVGAVSCFFFSPLIYASIFPPSGGGYAGAAPQSVSAPPASPAPVASKEKPSQEQAVAEYKAALGSVPNMGDFVADVRPGLIEGLVEIQVTTFYAAQQKGARQNFAVALWEAWVTASGLEDVDKARIRLVNRQGQQVGGSRVIGGSVIYVDD
jgi:hypothetical protein